MKSKTTLVFTHYDYGIALMELTEYLKAGWVVDVMRSYTNGSIFTTTLISEPVEGWKAPQSAPERDWETTPPLNEEELKEMPWEALRAYGNKLGVSHRGKQGLIKRIKEVWDGKA